MVKVTYTNIQTPILTIDDAIKKQSTMAAPYIPDIKVGNPERKFCLLHLLGLLKRINFTEQH